MENELGEIIDNFIIENIQKSISSLSSENNTCEFSAEHFNPDGYIKIENSDLANMLSATLSTAPIAISSVIPIVSSEQVNKIVQEGVFKVVFKNGVNDKTIADLCKNSEGFLTTVLHDSNGFNQAGLKSVGGEIENSLKNINTASVVSGVMTVASMVGGCYYMHDISKSLKLIINLINEIIQRDDDSKFAKLKAISETLLDFYNKFSSNLLSDDMIKAVHNLILKDCQDALEIVFFYERQLNKMTSKDIYIDPEKYRKYMNMFSTALEVYFIAIFMEVIFSPNYNSSYINQTIENMTKAYNKYKNSVVYWNKQALPKIEKSKFFEPELGEKLLNLFLDVEDFFTGNYTGKDNTYTAVLSKGDNHYYSEKYIEVYCTPKSDQLNQYINNLIKYEKRLNLIQNDEVELLYDNGDVYIDKKYLETEEN